MEQKHADDMIVLNKIHKVSNKDYEYYRHITELAISSCERGKKYLLKEVFGEEFWNLFSVGEAIRIGMCVARMVRNNELPLRFADVKSASRYYEVVI